MSLLTGSAWAQNHIATVDLRKLFDNYWKKKQAEAQLQERTADIQREDKNMIDDYKKAKDDYQTLLTSANDQAVSSEERDKRKKAAEDKFKQMKDQEDMITQYERQASTKIGEQRNRMRTSIIDEIRKVVDAKAKVAGYSLVIDIAAESVNTTPIILYCNNESDITDAVLAQLNATAPANAASTPDKPAAPKAGKQ
ncbi:MAG TPA: OmpH family outer membrane protein [Verrucomicrobiae bacterium]|nr:OmpH family outer membrane protein [Verrucomicrobiae bacterium]